MLAIFKVAFLYGYNLSPWDYLWIILAGLLMPIDESLLVDHLDDLFVIGPLKINGLNQPRCNNPILWLILLLWHPNSMQV